MNEISKKFKVIKLNDFTKFKLFGNTANIKVVTSVS